ncbi:microviridin/marinostatin family tricyclic proteinase inhibitor [Anabaena azotica]|uniref:Microviridin/marinostatin family tricyclic proteinase inhibitor n=1 Tax=Anabaena azotica FACHB-119 TaxID=947527 RepID=A0ABR8D738_9NOST|nr:microviridin/marinostatin family tricyclic proteinase inhibitor [Anabaena azotica]MBD2502504.1 microviridin/marinostatin family tricyclic proteinase inhibitor [Anabaena azotica FACHB-119]
MSTNTVKPANVEVVPFFARFLEEQAAQAPDHAALPRETLKYPSDWEEY